MNKVSTTVQSSEKSIVTPSRKSRYNHQQNKTAPLINYNSTDTIFQTTQRSNDDNRAHSFSKTKKPTTNSKYSQNGRNRVPWYCRILVVILAIIVAAVILVLLIFLVFQNRTITTTSTTTVGSGNPSNGVSTNAPSTGSVVSNSSTTSMGSTSSTGSPITNTSAPTSSISTVSTTTPMATVTITSNICTINWTGIEMIAQCINCTTYPFYYNYVYNYTATGTSSIIAFSLQRQATLFALDDVSVTNLATPSVQLLINGGFETGNITPWYYCNQNNLANTGGVKTFNFTYNGFSYYPNSGSYYYVGGSSIAADYLSQTFPTVTGQVYSVSLWFMLTTGGPLTSGALFLGV